MITRALSSKSRELPEHGSGAALGRHAGAHSNRNGGRRQRPRLPGRIAAPIALAAALVAIVLVVGANNKGSTKAAAPTVVVRPRSHHHFWIVRPNQTLSEIVARTGVSLTEIEALNPKLNPGALQTGQRIRIRR